ncbi:hypothetical protein JW758_06445 [Candidatus Peregrinibacteria bacterium]|nr:hypothetical protein [Candidatus Peregrinibacteria bacterium]
MGEIIDIDLHREIGHGESDKDIVLVTLDTGEQLIQTPNGMVIDVKGIRMMANDVPEEYQEIAIQLREQLKKHRALINTVVSSEKKAKGI